MAVFKTRIFVDQTRGAGMLNVLLAMAIIAMTAPFAYEKIADTNNEIRDMAAARDIIALRAPVLNFVRVNQDKWPDVAQIRLDEDELAAISDGARAGFIDKYSVRGAAITDVYLAFGVPAGDLRAARIARHIGDDAAVVGADGVAYGNAWAVAAPDFAPGDLIYRITRDVAGDDMSKYLHRAGTGQDDLNKMMRDLNMGGYALLDVGTVRASSAKMKDAAAEFVDAENIVSDAIYFSDGANMDGGDALMGALRITGDIGGFRNIYADRLNGAGYTTAGRIITDRATVLNSVNVARDLVLKSDTSRTISGFAGIKTNSVVAPYISAVEMVFYENFGLTVSGELLMSTTPPLKLGGWTFPSTTPPRFSEMNLVRAPRPAVPARTEFGVLFSSGWQEYNPRNQIK